MVLELPEFRRACFCLPLRHGILVMGYVNLAVTVFVILFEAWIRNSFDDMPISEEVGIHRGVKFPAPMVFIYVLYSLEAFFNVLLLIGAHMKKPKLLLAFFYFSLSTTLAAFASLLVVWALHFHQEHGLYHRVEEFLVAFFGLTTHGYLLLLIRSEVKKLCNNCRPYTFVNHTGEVVVDSPLGEGRNPL